MADNINFQAQSTFIQNLLRSFIFDLINSLAKLFDIVQPWWRCEANQCEACYCFGIDLSTQISFLERKFAGPEWFFVQFVKSKTKTLLKKGSLKFCLNNLWPSTKANSVHRIVALKLRIFFSSSTLVLVDTKAAAFRHSDSIQTSGKIWKSSPEIVVGIVWNVSLGLEQLPTPREENPQLVQSRWSI